MRPLSFNVRPSCGNLVAVSLLHNSRGFVLNVYEIKAAPGIGYLEHLGETGLTFTLKLPEPGYCEGA